MGGGVGVGGVLVVLMVCGWVGGRGTWWGASNNINIKLIIFFVKFFTSNRL